MKIDLRVDSTDLVLHLRNGERRLAYAVVNVINSTARRVQDAERQRVEGVFTIRKKDFMRREAAVIKPFANVRQGRPYAEIAVGQKPRLLLSAFERGGERRPATAGAKHVAVPVKGSPARPTFASPVPDALQWTRLRFRKTHAIGTRPSGRTRRTKPKTSGIWFGEQGTYLIPGVGVFIRGGQAGTRRLLYAFAKDVRLRPRLQFVKTAEHEAQKWFAEEMEREVINAIARAGGGEK